MNQHRMLIVSLLALLIIFLQSCSTLNRIAEDPYVQDRFKQDWYNFYGTEFPY